MKTVWILLGTLALVVVAVLWFGVEYLALFERGVEPLREQSADTKDGIAYRIEEVARGLEVPWSLAWTSPSRMLVTERPGRVRVIEKGELRHDPLHVFEEVSSTAEEGLMGLAISPTYSHDRHVYLSLAYSDGQRLFVKVLRFVDEESRLTKETVIIDRIPAARFHAGSRIAFGPDGMLYVTTGDATERALAQDLGSLAGKTLRLEPDGGIPSDNPFPDSPVWSYGHRNAQGIAWHPETEDQYQSEHGPSVFDGPSGGDEVNRIVRGENYGWPLVSHEETLEGTKAPLTVFTPAEAPASLLAYSGRVFREFAGNLFFGALRGEGIMRLTLDLNDPDNVTSVEKLSGISFGRIRAVAEGPDGFIYFSTSNRDGRGTPGVADDRILRLVSDL